MEINKLLLLHLVGFLYYFTYLDDARANTNQVVEKYLCLLSNYGSINSSSSSSSSSSVIIIIIIIIITIFLAKCTCIMNPVCTLPIYFCTSFCVLPIWRTWQCIGGTCRQGAPTSLHQGTVVANACNLCMIFR